MPVGSVRTRWDSVVEEDIIAFNVKERVLFI